MAPSAKSSARGALQKRNPLPASATNSSREASGHRIVKISSRPLPIAASYTISPTFWQAICVDTIGATFRGRAFLHIADSHAVAGVEVGQSAALEDQGDRAVFVDEEGADTLVVIVNSIVQRPPIGDKLIVIDGGGCIAAVLRSVIGGGGGGCGAICFGERRVTRRYQGTERTKGNMRFTLFFE